ncbi:MAG: hypothetical protein ACJAT6_001891 [Akkermansiaceae bacterium]|jgi:hypothetical protein
MAVKKDKVGEKSLLERAGDGDYPEERACQPIVEFFRKRL